MFVLHSSNKAENLLSHLTKVIEAQPLRSAFESETFLIQSQGMERWLSQQLANHFGVWGNYQFLFPTRFFGSLAQTLDKQLSSEYFERDRMVWLFLSLFDDLDYGECKPLRNYISGSNKALKSFQLAQRLAQVFDQYQILRLEMLAAWEKEIIVTDVESECWQSFLWKKLVERIGNIHRGSLMQKAIEKLIHSPAGSLTDRLPERVSVFGLNTMPPLFLDFLTGLANHIQVHFYMLNPTQAYWTDIETKRQIAIRNFQTSNQREIEPIFQTGHPLLASLGQQGREFQEMLLERGTFNLEFDSFETDESEVMSNLGHLQNSLLSNRLEEKTLTIDGSVSIHSCHSRMREVEIIKDQLLETLECDFHMELRDIVVMAPDIQVYAPFISAVFRDIDHTIADRSLRANNGILDAFIHFLRLSQSRFGWQLVIDLLEKPEVHPTFGLSETDLEQIRNWIQQTGIRWGRSSEHKNQLGLPALDQNTWQLGIDRLFMGYAVGDEEDFVDHVLPFTGIEGSAAQALGGLSEYMQFLFEASATLSRPKPLKSWAVTLFQYADKLFGEKLDNEPDRQVLNELLSEITGTIEEIHTTDVTLEVIVAWLESTLSERKSSKGFLRGQLTFCSMLPMRSIPFKVIALLGMNEGEFPKIDRCPTFDLLDRFYQKGDRSRRADDRYQFLEVLLAARKKLIITYIGQSIQQNISIPPSVVVSELLEIFATSFSLFDLVIEHPLQPFSSRYFDGHSKLFSYSTPHCDTAKALAKTGQEQLPWWHGEIQPQANEIIDLSDLFEFFRHPHKYFAKHILQLRLNGIEKAIEEREPFILERLDEYNIDQEWIVGQLGSQNHYLSVEKLQAQGRWISGTPGQLLFEKKRCKLDAFIKRVIQKSMGSQLPDQTIDIQIGNHRLVGKLTNLFQHGSMIYRYATLKGRDFFKAWLHHLIINRVIPQITCLLSKDDDLLFEPNLGQEDDLHNLIEIYLQGQKSPSILFPESTLAYINHTIQSTTQKTAIDIAREKLILSINNGYEAEMSLLYRHVEDPGSLLDEKFENYCKNRLKPVWEAVHKH